jgi:hypothetical protein
MKSGFNLRWGTDLSSVRIEILQFFTSHQPVPDVLVPKKLCITYAIHDHFKVKEKLLYTYIQIIDLDDWHAHEYAPSI